MRDAVLRRGGWVPVESKDCEEDGKLNNGKIFRHDRSPNVYMWSLPPTAEFLVCDFVDKAFLKRLQGLPKLSEVIFMSRHAARSGKPALTIHPIGNPRASKWTAQLGGKPGLCPPPSPRMGKMFRLLKQCAQDRGLTDEFDVTFEATHHGPFLDTPSMFVEIGSCEEHWCREDAGECWADVLERFFSQDTASDDSDDIVMSIGGGHYVPFMSDFVLKHKVTPGHMLPSYLMDDVSTDYDVTPEWEIAVREAIDSTQRAIAGSQRRLSIYVDKKSLKSEARKRVVELVAGAVGVSHHTTNKKDVVRPSTTSIN
ncbi:hypothetical protein AAMO2058_000051300 [Amorphochlora amoebiformis]|uniref:D-aminoacyl-tRNA deacylase n=1 Tax=Amorphochlora amoebiformis TaxID=1561963 RepID=A0A7S0DGG7_9EUKA|mmetsp:Transcript_26454/g.41876  ORF Transcript_26454/g.41876 Transcript_26454/m.41876 type:complete len:312 (+) Transcript_26454:263-1198(+)